jgi:RNA 3'-terminal phosphate cyclase (ATP)
MDTDPLIIDGSHGEGGGQILRTCASLGAITGRAVTIRNVRAGRPVPGLKAQHLTSIDAAMALCGGMVEGGSVGAREVTLIPGGPVIPGEYTFEIGTAGATMLVLQTVAVPLMLAGGGSVTIRGGTHNTHAPSSDFVREVFLHVSGVPIELRVDRLGFYPRGGGEVIARLGAARDGFAPVNLADRPARAAMSLHVALSDALPVTIAERAEARVRRRLKPDADGLAVHVDRRPTLSPSVSLLLVAHYGDVSAGFTAHGKRGVPTEDLVDDLIREYRDFERGDGVVDEHLADQLVLPMLFAAGPSRYRAAVVSEHLRTMAWLVGQWGVGRVTINDDRLVEVTPAAADTALSVG